MTAPLNKSEISIIVLIVIRDRQQRQAHWTGQEQSHEHELVNHECIGTEPPRDGTKAKLAAPCDPDVQLMDYRDSQRNNEPAFCADSKNLTLLELVEISQERKVLFQPASSQWRSCLDQPDVRIEGDGQERNRFGANECC